MTSAQTRFDMLKLQLTRLNEDWSLTGDTFCHQAAMHIRQAVWNDNDMMSPIRQLTLAVAHMVKRYVVYMTPETAPAKGIAIEHKLERWNQFFTASAHTMDELESFLTQKQRDMLAHETIETYQRLF